MLGFENLFILRMGTHVLLGGWDERFEQKMEKRSEPGKNWPAHGKKNSVNMCQ
jgi:hypothetical protein